MWNVFPFFLTLISAMAAAADPPSHADLARSLFYQAKALTPSDVNRAALLDQALHHATVGKSEKDPRAGLVWWVAVRGERALSEGVLSALGALSDLETAMLQLKSLDPDFDHAAADRVLGHLYHVAPGFISIGSSRKAREHFEEALRRSPSYPGNLVMYADFLASQGESEKAKALVKQAQQSKSWKTTEEGADWVKTAQKVLSD